MDEGPDADFRTLWRETFPRLVVYASAAGVDREAARDLAQEILWKVHRGLPSFDSSRSLRAWIWAIAGNHLRDWFRREARRKRRETALPGDREPPDPLRGGPPEVLAADETRRAVAAYVDGLPTRRRQIAYLRFYEDMPLARIAEAVGAPEGTVKYEVHEIRRGLREYLEVQHDG